MRYWSIFFLFSSNYVFSQSIITGKITDRQQAAVSNINVTLHLPNTSAILAFGITDKQGNYTISYKSAADLLEISAFGFGYAKQQKSIQNKTQDVGFVLSEQNIALKEVIVKEKPITRNGDTLSYAVSAFKNQSDRSIGDLIKRLPGLEVDANGRIFYQGKPINKYYIEGLDLLSGRYSLANENLPVDAVTHVEVLENHQPIRVLDSLVFSENAALNIRLKNKVTATGTARLGAGAAPALWDANVTPMVFGKSQQLIASYQSNNLGNNVAKQIKVLTIDDVLNPFEHDASKKNWVRIVPLATPSFSDTRWLDNQIHLGSLNFLQKLPKGYELKANLSYLHDNQRQIGGTRTINYTPQDTITFDETKRNSYLFEAIDASLILEKNDKGGYLKNQLSFKGQWDKETGLLQLNNSPISQQATSPYFSLTNSLKDIFKFKNRAITFQSFINFQNSPQSLTVAPGPFAGLLNNKMAFDLLRQTTTTRSFFTHNKVSFNQNIGKFSLAPQIGFQVEKQSLGSQMQRFSANELPTMIGNDYANQLEWLKVNAYLKLQTQYQKDKWRLTLNTPVNHYFFRVEDEPLKQQQNLDRLTFEPKLNVRYDLNPFWALSSSIDKKNTFGEIENLFYGYLLKNYRTLERRNAPLLDNVSWGTSFNIRYRNPLTSVFGYAIYTTRTTNNNLIYGTRIATQGASEGFALPMFNKSYTQSVILQVGKFFSALKTQVSLDYQSTFSEQQQIINGTNVPVKNQNNSFGVKVNGKIAKWADFDYNFKRFGFENQVNNRESRPASQQIHELNLSFYPTKSTFVGLKNEYYTNNFTSRKSQNIFSDFIIRYTFRKHKIDIETNWNNIWNTSQLSFISVNAFSVIESNYQLRPVQVVQKIRFSF